MSIIRKLNVLFASILDLFTFSRCRHNMKDRDVSSNNQHLFSTKSGYISVESGKLFYQRFGKGDPIIVLHGGPGLDQSYLLPQMLELAQDYELIF